MKILLALGALLLAGCASLPDTLAALSKDNASVCVSLDATLYGHVVFCRTNTNGMAALGATKDGVSVQHSGTK